MPLYKMALFALAMMAQAPARAQDVFLTQPGQPFCVTADDLKAYLMAGLLNDQSAEWNCALLKKDLKLRVLAVVGKSEIGEVVLAEVASPLGKGSGVGYTLNIGMKRAP